MSSLSQSGQNNSLSTVGISHFLSAWSQWDHVWKRFWSALSLLSPLSARFPSLSASSSFWGLFQTRLERCNSLLTFLMVFLSSECKVNEGKQLTGIGVATLPSGGRVGKVDGPSECNKMCKQNSECKAWHVKASPSSSRDRCSLFRSSVFVYLCICICVFVFVYLDRCTLFRDSRRKKAGKFHLWGEKQDC